MCFWIMVGRAIYYLYYIVALYALFIRLTATAGLTPTDMTCECDIDAPYLCSSYRDGSPSLSSSNAGATLGGNLCYAHDGYDLSPDSYIDWREEIWAMHFQTALTSDADLVLRGIATTQFLCRYHDTDPKPRGTATK